MAQRFGVKNGNGIVVTVAVPSKLETVSDAELLECFELHNEACSIGASDDLDLLVEIYSEIENRGIELV